MPSAVAAFRLLPLAGRRPSEIQFLRLEYVKDDHIKLPDAKTLSGESCRSNPRPAVLANLLARRTIPGSSPAGCGAPASPTCGSPGAASARAGLENVRIHDLRRRYASRTLALGESLTMIGKLLGHTQVHTTARYAHLARASIRNAAARTTGSIGGNLSSVQRAEETDRHWKHKISRAATSRTRRWQNGLDMTRTQQYYCDLDTRPLPQAQLRPTRHPRCQLVRCCWSLWWQHPPRAANRSSADSVPQLCSSGMQGTAAELQFRCGEGAAGRLRRHMGNGRCRSEPIGSRASRHKSAARR